MATIGNGFRRGVKGFALAIAYLVPCTCPADAAESPSPAGGRLSADHTFTLAQGKTSESFRFSVKDPGQATLVVRGLSLGGEVLVELDGQRCGAVELLAARGPEQGKADAARIAVTLAVGEHQLAVSEKPGVQVVRRADTNHYFGATSDAGGRPLFSVDLDALKQNNVEYPVSVHYGPGSKPFFSFSGKFDMYHGDSYTERITDVAGTSGATQATLRYTADHPPRNLVMPMSITLVRGPDLQTFSLRVRQVLRATGKPSFGGNLEFLHLVINPVYGLDWQDGEPDFVWYRAQRDDAADTLPGSHTTLVRMDDNSSRGYPYPASTADPSKIAYSGAHHTGAAVAMEAANTIGGWFAEAGVGCIGLVFHQYKANFRDDLTPLHSHCGDGADTHHYVFWEQLYAPLGMQKPGDEVEIEYSLFALPSEPKHTDVEDLNEADLCFFGKFKEQKSQIVGWQGTKNALGLLRSDGSAILLGIGREPGTVRLPEPTCRQVRRAFRAFDIARPKYERLKIADGAVEVRPGWITVVDGGSAIKGPEE
jgi:hypothetical protein